MSVERMNDAISDRDALNTRKRRIVLEAMETILPLVGDEYRWQRTVRGCSARAAHRETQDWIDGVLAHVAEELRNELDTVFIGDQ